MLEIVKKYVLNKIKEAGEKYHYLLIHVPMVEKWALKILKTKPKASKDIVLLSVWLHDIGQLYANESTDHAILSEEKAIRLLKQLGYDDESVKKVAHCVRAHRCKDVQPETLEAKIVAVSDSASHMTDTIYLDMAADGRAEEAKGKLERDFRDNKLFPELAKEIEPLYLAWKQLLENYPVFN